MHILLRHRTEVYPGSDLGFLHEVEIVMFTRMQDDEEREKKYNRKSTNGIGFVVSKGNRPNDRL